MTWTKLDEDMPWRPPLMSVKSRSARHLHTEALVWSTKFGQDGVIPASSLRDFTDARSPKADAEMLVSAGVWERTEDGYLIVDSLEDQPTAEDVAKTQVLSRDRQRKQRQHRNGDHSLCDPDYCRAAKAQGVGANPKAPGKPKPPTQPEDTHPPVKAKPKAAPKSKAPATKAPAKAPAQDESRALHLRGYHSKCGRECPFGRDRLQSVADREMVS